MTVAKLIGVEGSREGTRAKAEQSMLEGSCKNQGKVDSGLMQDISREGSENSWILNIFKRQSQQNLNNGIWGMRDRGESGMI